MFQIVEKECFLLEKVNISPNMPVSRIAFWMKYLLKLDEYLLK